MTVLNMNNKAMRFYGRIKHTGSKADNEPVILLSLETDGKPGYSKILFHTRIRDDNMRDELIRLVQSDNVQLKPVKLWQVLQNCTFSSVPNLSMFNVLMGLDVIRDYPSDRLVVEMPNNEFWSVQQVLDGIRVNENARLMQTTGASAKLVNNMREQDAKANNRLNSVEDRLGKLEDLLTKMVETQEALLKGTSTKTASKKAPKVEPVEEVNEAVEEFPGGTEEHIDAYEDGLPPRYC